MNKDTLKKLIKEELKQTLKEQHMDFDSSNADYSKDKYSQLKRRGGDIREGKSKESEIEKLEKEIKDLEKEFNALSPKQKDKKWTPEALKLMKAQRETRVKINKLKRQIKTGSEGSGYVKRHGENKGKPIEKKK